MFRQCHMMNMRELVHIQLCWFMVYAYNHFIFIEPLGLTMITNGHHTNILIVDRLIAWFYFVIGMGMIFTFLTDKRREGHFIAKSVLEHQQIPKTMLNIRKLRFQFHQLAIMKSIFVYLEIANAIRMVSGCKYSHWSI